MIYESASASALSRISCAVFAAFLLAAVARPVFAQSLSAPPGEQELGATLDETSSPLPASPPTTLRFGTSLAIEGRTLLIGMPAYSEMSRDAPPNAGGRVAVFSLSVANRWLRSGTIDPAVHTPDDQFGRRVALGGRLALVASLSGVFVFERRNAAWHQIAKLTPTAHEHYDGGLAVSNGSLLIGVSVDDAPGRVYAFAQDRHGDLHRTQQLRAFPAEESDEFGRSLAASHGTLVVGAPGFAEGQGAAFVYQQFGHRWMVYRRLAPTDQPAPTLGAVSFGAAVDISRDLIAIGAPGADRYDSHGEREFTPSGAAYVFSQRGWRWSLDQKVGSPDACAFDFAQTVAISHDYLAAGSPSAFPGLVKGAHVYQRIDDTYTLRYEVFKSEVGLPPVVLDGSHLVVGFPGDRFFSTGFADAYDLAEAP